MNTPYLSSRCRPLWEAELDRLVLSLKPGEEMAFIRCALDHSERLSKRVRDSIPMHEEACERADDLWEQLDTIIADYLPHAEQEVGEWNARESEREYYGKVG